MSSYYSHLQYYYAPFQIPFGEIESATNNFADENLVAQGTSFNVYKGQLSHPSGDLINIVARRSTLLPVLENELRILKGLKHKNIVYLFKLTGTSSGTIDNYDHYCIIIVNKQETNGSLDKHLTDPTLTWMQRLHICVGVASLLKYLHYDAEDDHYVIHGNIKTSKILLDHNWEPKLHGFGFAIRARKHLLVPTFINTRSLQHLDPAYESTRGLTHKSDVFSFGVVLFEVLFGREACIQNNDNLYFARSARSHYEANKLDDLIHPDLRKQMNQESLDLFTEAAYYCLKEQRSERPNIDQVLSKLEKARDLQHNHEHPVMPDAIGATSLSDHLKAGSLDRLRFQLSDIEHATNKFSESCCIGSGGFATVYKAKLDLPDGINSSVLGGSIVAIKRITSRNDKLGEEGFLKEIELLSKCKHPNIVSLQGFCFEREEMILVYEYVSNGSVGDYFGRTYNMINLTWAQRIQICLDVAHGLHYLHREMEDKQVIIHRDIKSDNILLDGKWRAKIADFGLSKLHHEDERRSTIFTNHIAGTNLYLDPEYLSTGKLKTKSDVYSLGVVLFEIMCGKVAYDQSYGQKGLPSIARERFNDGTLKRLVDPKLMEAGDEHISMLFGGVNEDSLDAFTKIAHQCLAITQSERPTTAVIIQELTNALHFQENNSSKHHISLDAIKLGTRDFSDYKLITEERLWKLYAGEIEHANRVTTVFVKRWDSKSPKGGFQFRRELENILKHKHKNIIGLLGYCEEMNEKIIVYEHGCIRRLSDHLDDPNLTWMRRLHICIDIGNGLESLHTGPDENSWMIHRDIKSSSILLDSDWNAKISNLEIACRAGILERAEHVDENTFSSLGYTDPKPKYTGFGFLLTDSDIYSLGVILLEMLCGRLAWAEGCADHSLSLGPVAVRHYKKNKNLDDMIFMGIRGQIGPRSLTTFISIALQCLKYNGDDRPKTHEVVTKLEEALEYQKDYEIWEPKLPIDYQKICEMSSIGSSTEMKKDLYDMFSKGILLRDGKVLFSLGTNGERNEMISAKKISCKNSLAYRWQFVKESRFQKVMELFEISKLQIRINVTTRFLSPGVNYGAHIIFKFRDTIQRSRKPMYVNLKYRKGRENLRAYFATWRDDNWMTIELCRFLCHKEDTTFEVLLESFSKCYCGKGSIYVEGIEFRVIDKVKNDEVEQTPQTLKSNSNSTTEPFDVELMSLNEVKETKRLMLSGVEEVDDCGKKYLLLGTSTVSSSLHGSIGFEPQIIEINSYIPTQRLSPDTEYLCYIVFKLSEHCHGLHCPIRVRGPLHRNSRKEAQIIYFRSPSPWNLHENYGVPEEREDGWMEVTLCTFNSSHQLQHDYIPLHLKLITYEGTMSGLILYGLEFRAAM